MFAILLHTYNAIFFFFFFSLFLYYRCLSYSYFFFLSPLKPLDFGSLFFSLSLFLQLCRVRFLCFSSTLHTMHDHSSNWRDNFFYSIRLTFIKVARPPVFFFTYFSYSFSLCLFDTFEEVFHQDMIFMLFTFFWCIYHLW